MRALLSRHRRLLAAFLAAVAAVAGLAAARPRAHGVRVLVAARDLPAGATLRAADLAGRVLPARAVPDGVVSRAAGRILAAPVRRGEPLTDVRLRDRSLLDTVPGGPDTAGRSGAGGGPGGTGGPGSSGEAGAPNVPGATGPGAAGTPGEMPGSGAPDATGRPGSPGPPDEPGAGDPADAAGAAGDVATPVRLADAAVAGLLHPGDRVDVLAARAEGPPGARTVAAAVTVVAVPRPGPDATEGALVVLRTSRAEAAALARAAVDSRLTVTVVG